MVVTCVAASSHSYDLKSQQCAVRRSPAEAEAVVRTAFGVGLALFDDDFPLMVRQPGFVLDVPAQRLEERGNEIHARLRLQVVLREVVMLVSVELSDKLLEAL